MILNKTFLSQVKRIIEGSKNSAIRAVNFERVLMCWKIGEAIVKEEQGGKGRAEYGAYLIKSLS